MFHKFYIRIYYIAFFGLSLLTQISYSMTEDLQNESVPLDVVIALDNGSDYEYFKAGGKEAPAVSETVARAIKDNIPFICSSHLLYIIKNDKRYNPQFKLLESDIWNLYENLDKDFVVGVPKKNLINLRDISYIGINKTAVNLIPQSKINELAEETLTLLQKEKNEVNIENLKKLLINPYARKRIFLVGHGNFSGELLKDLNEELAKKFKASIASLPLEKYREVLVFLNDIGTDLVYVLSCYSGGLNIYKFQERDLQTTQPLRLSYFLIIGSVTDEIAVEIPNLADFFKEVNAFFSTGPTTNVTFTKMLKALGLEKYLQDIPSVRFPGNVNYFKAVDIDKRTEILTYSKAMAPVLEAKLSHKPITTLALTDKKALLVYPLFIEVPIEINMDLEWGLTTLISMIPGNAFHYFVNLSINEKTSFEKLLYSMFFYTGFKIPSEKVVFIENFKVNTYDNAGLPSNELKNVIIDKKLGYEDSIMIAKVGDQFYKADITWNVAHKELHEPKFQPIDTAEAKSLISKIATNIKNKTLPGAVSQASGGQENIEEVYKKIIKNFA